MNKTSKVFICHSSKDKDRFVNDFAKRLRKNGIDAWYDEWEIKPGDSLPEKVFVEGIDKSDYFIIVISKNSIDSKWVKEELNSAIKKKIEKKTKIIPIILDGIEEDKIPTQIQHLLWIRINDIENYDEEFKNIVNTIFNVDIKPPLGDKPKIEKFSYTIQSLEKTDTIVLKIIGDYIYEKDDLSCQFDFPTITNLLKDFNLPDQEIYDSLDILDTKGLMKVEKLFPYSTSIIFMTPKGYFLYCQHFVENFNDMKKDIISFILNNQPDSNKIIEEKFNYKKSIIYSIIEYYGGSGYLKTAPLLEANSTKILEITANGRREFKKILEE